MLKSPARSIGVCVASAIASTQLRGQGGQRVHGERRRRLIARQGSRRLPILGGLDRAAPRLLLTRGESALRGSLCSDLPQPGLGRGIDQLVHNLARVKRG